MRVAIADDCRRLLERIGVSEDRVVAVCNNRTRGVVVHANPPLMFGVRWFPDGEIVFVSAVVTEPQPTGERLYIRELSVQLALRLRNSLPCSSIDPEMKMAAILERIAASFGVPVTCHAQSPPSRTYGGIWDGLPPRWEAQAGDEFFLQGSFDPVKMTCNWVWVFSLNSYLSWFTKPAIEVLALKVVRQSIPEPAADRPIAETASHAARALDALCDEFSVLIEQSGGDEEELHKWLNDKRHHIFLDPHAVDVRSKVPFGAKISDFVIRRSDGTYSVVEIERADTRVFRRDNSEPTSEFNHACQQVRDWQRYIRDNVQTVRSELGLHNIYEPVGVVVLGRKGSITGQEANRRWIDLKNRRDPKVFTYDELCDGVRALAKTLRSVTSIEGS